MDLKSTNLAAALIVSISAGLGGTIFAGFIFFEGIWKPYNNLRKISRHAQIKYWMGFVAMSAVGTGLGMCFNEIGISVYLNQNIKFDNLLRGVLTVVVWPVTLLLFTVLALKIIPDRSQQSQVVAIEPPKELELKEMNGGVKIALLVCVALVLCVSLYLYFSPCQSCVRSVSSSPNVTEGRAAAACAGLLGGGKS
jgi:uncharacterized membrane protein YhaH (DUF805 family)